MEELLVRLSDGTQDQEANGTDAAQGHQVMCFHACGA